jgi:hypothetical protein
MVVLIVILEKYSEVAYDLFICLLQIALYLLPDFSDDDTRTFIFELCSKPGIMFPNITDPPFEK